MRPREHATSVPDGSRSRFPGTAGCGAHHHLAETGRRVRVNDLWIAAVAASRGLPVVTRDDDFDPLDGAAGVPVIRV